MKLTAYRLHDAPYEIRNAEASREWMDKSIGKAAYRCLPLVIANTCGWDILLNEDIMAVWNGGQDAKDLVVHLGDEQAKSHFGAGTITFHTGYMFQTEPGWSLWVKGSANRIPSGIFPLEGIVETSWLPFTFTMNWRFTEKGKIFLERGTPICTIVPIKLSELEKFEPEILSIKDNPELGNLLNKWSDSRYKHIADHKPDKQGFYADGTDSDGNNISIEHRKKLNLKKFKNNALLP